MTGIGRSSSSSICDCESWCSVTTSYRCCCWNSSRISHIMAAAVAATVVIG